MFDNGKKKKKSRALRHLRGKVRLKIIGGKDYFPAEKQRKGYLYSATVAYKNIGYSVVEGKEEDSRVGKRLIFQKCYDVRQLVEEN